MSNQAKILFHERALSEVKTAVHRAGLTIGPIHKMDKNIRSMSVTYPTGFNLDDFMYKLRHENTDVK